MNVLMVGSGKGSWTMRGVQLGAAIGARVVNAPSAADLGWADLVVLLKRAGAVYATLAHQRGLPIVWDAIDFWHQPRDCHATESQAKALLHAQIKVIKPALVIGATQAMADACEGVYLPHHHWEGLTPTPVRESVATVAYEGNEVYLGAWRLALMNACQSRGWRFVVNPPDLRQVDLLVSFRDGPWDGWMAREWKSGVKVVNAIAAGRPLIAHASAAMRELAPDGSVIAQPSELGPAFDFWADAAARRAVVDRAETLAPRYALAEIAAQYRQILQAVPRKAVAC